MIAPWRRSSIAGNTSIGQKREAEQIRVHHPHDIFARRSSEGSLPANARVVDENIYLTVALDSTSDQGINLSHVGDIGGDGEGLAASRHDRPRLRVKLISPARRQHHTRTPVRQLASGGRANARTGTRHQRNLAFQWPCSHSISPFNAFTRRHTML